MIKKMKHTELSKGAKVAIDYKIKGYGKMLKFKFDSKRKSIEMEVVLNEEHEFLTVHAKNYETTEEDGKYLLQIYGVSTSKPWINAIVFSYSEGKSFEIPAEYAKMLKIII